MKRLLLILGILLPMVLQAQRIIDEEDIVKGFTYVPILEGRFYGIKDEKTGKCGVVKERILFIHSKEDIAELLVVPAIYDDIGIVKIVSGGQILTDFCSFYGVKDGKKTIYKSDGLQLTEPVDAATVWHANAGMFDLVGLSRKDGQGYDLQIDKNIDIPGPFSLAWFERKESEGKPYYHYIIAKRYGSEEYVKYDVFGSPLSDEDVLHLDAYYNKLSARLGDDRNKMKGEDLVSNTYNAAIIGNRTAIIECVIALYTNGVYQEVVDWGWGPGLNFRVGPSTYYAAKCLRYGKGVPMNIYQAKYLFQKTLEFSKAQEFGYKEASEELAGIDKIEQPIQLKTGLKPAIDRWLADSDELEDLAKDGDIEAITIYCYRTMMMSWVLYYNDGITKRLFGDKEAVDMLPMLLAAAPNEVTCQLILAIIYAGPEAMGLNRDFTYSFRDPEKAKYWLEKFCSNPKRSDAFYWSKKYEVDDIIIPNIRGMK